MERWRERDGVLCHLILLIYFLPTGCGNTASFSQAWRISGSYWRIVENLGTTSGKSSITRDRVPL